MRQAAASQPSDTDLRMEDPPCFPFHRILHPTDFSECSRQAFQLASSLAHDYGARLILLYVAEAPKPFGGVAMAPSKADLDTFQELLDGLTPDEPYVKVERRVMVGNVSREILETAQELKCDMIVMGTHRRRGWSRVLAPSVAERVARQSPCPVLTVK